MEQSDTRELVERARAGDRPAFDELARRYRDGYASVIDRRLKGALRQPANVDDVLQETLVRALRGLDRFRWPTGEDAGGGGAGGANPFFRWLSRISVRIIFEHARRARKEPPLALDFDAPDRDEVSPGRALARRERMERFQEALSGLSEDHRTVLRLVRIERLPLAEVARRMDRSPNAVSQLVLRALRAMRQKLDRMSGTGSLNLPPEGLEGTEREEDRHD